MQSGQHEVRAAPSQKPPMLARFIPARWAQRSSLRPAVLMIAFFGAMYALFATAATIRRRNNQDTSYKLHTMYLALIILYALTAVIEFFGVAAVYRSSIKLVKMYFLASVAVAIILTGAELTRLVLHFVDKSSIISACFFAESLEDPASADTGAIQDYCQSLWRHNVYWDVGLLVFSFFVSFLFASVIASYLQQLLNPALTRQHFVGRTNIGGGGGAASNNYAYPLSTVYPPNPYGQPQFNNAPPNYQPGYVPAYDAGGFVPPPTDEKDVGMMPARPEGAAANPFSDRSGMTAEEYEQRQHEDMLREEAEERRTRGAGNREAMESTDTVTLEPRRENEGRV